MNQKLITRKELAMLLRTSIATVDRIIARKEVPYIKFGATKKSRVLFKEAEIIKYIESKEIKNET